MVRTENRWSDYKERVIIMARVKKRKRTRPSNRKKRSRSRRAKKMTLTQKLMQPKFLIPLLVIAAIVAYLFGSGALAFSATGARLELDPAVWENIWDFGFFEGIPTIGTTGLIVFMVIVVVVFLLVIVLKNRRRVSVFRDKRRAGQAKSEASAARERYMESMSDW